MDADIHLFNLLVAKVNQPCSQSLPNAVRLPHDRPSLLRIE